MISTLRDLTAGQWALRVTMVAGVMVALLATGLVGVWPAPWLMVLVGALALGYALLPENSVGTVAMGFVLAWWGIAFRDGLHPQALLAAAGLLLAHLAGLLAAYGPARLAVDRATVVLWARRGAAVFVMSPLVYLVAVGVRDLPEPDGLWVAGLGAALVAIGVAAAGLLAGRVEE